MDQNTPEPPPQKPSIPEDDGGKEEKSKNGYTRPSKGKFRFKSKSSHDDERHHRHSRSHSHKHKHHHKRRSKKPSRSASPGEKTKGLSPDTAFRESLFDALGDDEGAAYWESVYGQPIHTYSVPGGVEGPDGELERMTEEEYAAYVRARMWERTREGMLEEQERLRAEKAKRRRRERESDDREQERVRFERAMEESLARGEERRKRKAWKGAWEAYRESWERIEKAVSSASAATPDEGKRDEGNKLRNMLFWPVESGKRRDISRQNVEEFMQRAPPPGSAQGEAGGLENLMATLKMERVRWHPDKIQHRYGVLGTDEPVMRSVTEVFQILDDLWNEVKK